MLANISAFTVFCKHSDLKRLPLLILSLSLSIFCCDIILCIACMIISANHDVYYDDVVKRISLNIKPKVMSTKGACPNS